MENNRVFMKAYMTNNLIRTISHFKEEEEFNAFLEAYKQASVNLEIDSFQLHLNWPSFLEIIDLEALFWSFHPLNEEDALYNFLLSMLNKNDQQVLLTCLYDQVFIDCLTKVKKLPQIDQTFLLNQIQKKRDLIQVPLVKKLFAASLNYYEKLLQVDPYHTIHDLTLYLAWDRVCVNLAVIFEHPSFKSVDGLTTLKECLIESFQHITKQGETTPGFFRFMEALYAILMREENLPIYSEEEWLILCQSAEALRSREIVCDAPYIDRILVDKYSNSKKRAQLILTLDSIEKVNASLKLAEFEIKKLNQEKMAWNYSLSPVEIVCFKQENQKLLFNTIIRQEYF